MRRLITGELVASEFAAGRKTISAPRDSTIITPEAWTQGHELGVTFDQSPVPVTTPAAVENASAERVVDPSGLVLVRGDTVKLARFPGAGPDRNVGLADVISGRDGSPMTAGIMSWGRADSFPWTLDYDEVDLVLEGVLQITIGGRMLEGRAGDVFYIPKGSKILFGTPWRTKVFYVTYPADWAAASTAPARPQK